MRLRRAPDAKPCEPYKREATPSWMRADQNEAVYDIQDAWIAVDDAGNAMAAWFRSDAIFSFPIQRINASRYNVTTNGWSTPRMLSTQNTYLEQLSVAMDRLDNGLVMWGSNGINGWAVSHVARYVAGTG